MFYLMEHLPNRVDQIPNIYGPDCILMNKNMLVRTCFVNHKKILK